MSDRRYDESVRAIVARATAEARRRGDRRLGTDHLLVGTLEDQRVAGALGMTATQARERIDVLDRDALAAIGLAVDGFVTAPTAALDDRIPLSSGTREVLRRAARWFEDDGRLDDAARHLVEAGDFADARELLSTHFVWFFDRGWGAAP